MKLLRSALVLTLVLATLVSCFALPVAATDDGKMAYNIYSHGDASATSGHFDTYMIDFMSTIAPETTYWALANYSMFLRSAGTKAKFRNIGGGGAYCGLQHTTKQVAIMSFWEWTYGRNEIHNAHRIYPKGADNEFGGEGNGVNWIANYDWQPGNWYRMALHSWQDQENGTTMVGTWYLDVATGKWTLFCYYDTGLVDSYMIGDMSLFMENFGSWNSEPVREVRFKNMYVLDHDDGKWYSMPKAYLSCDDGATNKTGTFEFGSTDEYFWAKTEGIHLEDQKAYLRTAKKSYTATIQQPEQPSFAATVIDSIESKKTDKGLRVNWTLGEQSAPQGSYLIELLDKDGKVVASKSETRPEVDKVDFEGLDSLDVTIRLTVTDIFGGSATATADSDPLAVSKGIASLQELVDELSAKKPAKGSESAYNDLLAKCKDAIANGIANSKALTKLMEEVDALKAQISYKEGPSAGLLAGIGGGALVVIAGVVAAIVASKKKKKKDEE